MSTLAGTSAPRADWKTAPGLGAAGRAAMRVLIWIALWAEALRTVATVAGVWSAGSWSIFATLFVGVLAPAWMFLLSPTWLGWRILYRVPLPRRRLKRGRARRDDTPLGRTLFTAAARIREALLVASCWLSPLCRARDLAGIRVFVRLREGRPFPDLRRVPAGPWTVLAVALQAERQGNQALVDRIVDALVCLPPGARFPWLARVHGGEALMLAATRRRDFPAALRYAAVGRGRMVRLLAAIAEAHTAGRAPRRRLWLLWALAPGRLRTWPLARAASRRLVPPARVTPPPSPSTPNMDRVAASDDGSGTPDPRRTHVRLLEQVARGHAPSLPEVLALGATWSRALAPAAVARLGARAMELDVRHPDVAAGAIRERVLGELTELAVRAEGPLPESGALPDKLAAELVDRAREHLARSVEMALASLVAPDAAASGPLEAWTRWLAVRAVVEEVEQRGGRVMLTLLWHASVRNIVWRWASVLFDRQPAPTAWMAHMIFTWVADHAERAGDLGGQLTNRENARVALATEARDPW